MHHFQKKNSKIFSPERSRKIFGGPARMFPQAPLWLSTGLVRPIKYSKERQLDKMATVKWLINDVLNWTWNKSNVQVTKCHLQFFCFLYYCCRFYRCCHFLLPFLPVAVITVADFTVAVFTANLCRPTARRIEAAGRVEAQSAKKLRPQAKIEAAGWVGLHEHTAYI